MAITKVTSKVLEDNVTVAGNLDVSSGTIKLDGNYPTGTGNVALGDTSLADGSLSGGNNTAIGSAALRQNTTGANNTASGGVSMYSNTTGSDNTAVGYDALSGNTTASNNTAVGKAALKANTTGNDNGGFGFKALTLNTTGNDSVAVGAYSLQRNTTGSSNVSVGYDALGNNTTASNNTAVGFEALQANTTGAGNTAVGGDSLKSVTTGIQNTALGQGAGNSLTTGSGNVFIGGSNNATNSSGGFITTGSRNVILGNFDGNQGGLDIRTSSNNIVLADGSGNPRGIFDSSGNFLVGTTSALSFGSNSNEGVMLEPNTLVASRAHNGALYLQRSASDGGIAYFYKEQASVGNISVTGSATSYNTSSDYRLKENVDYTWDATTRLKQLKPARFNFIDDDTNTLVDGFLAHEVQDIVPEAISGEKDAVDSDGNPEYQGIDQSKLVPLLVKTIQELEARITALES